MSLTLTHKKCTEGIRLLSFGLFVLTFFLLQAPNSIAQDEEENIDQGEEEKDEELELQRAPEEAHIPLATRVGLYAWNRTADFFDVFDFGIAFGPAIGGEIAVTDKAQLGAYAAAEKGFTSTIPPFWFIPYLHKQREVPDSVHQGTYWRTSFGPWYRHNSIRKNVHFPQKEEGARLQLALGIAHLHGGIDFTETYDFLSGLVLEDSARDDQEPNPYIRRQPFRQFGRGAANVVLGAWEIPKTMMIRRESENDVAAFFSGGAAGFWRFLARTGVGVFEVFTFPMGWNPIIKPEFVIGGQQKEIWKITPIGGGEQ